jgi:hypothetical protein
MNIVKTENLVDWVKAKPLPKVSALTPTVFEENGFRPFVFEDQNIKSITDSWDLDYYNSKIGHVNAQVYVSADGTFPGGKGPYDPEKYRIVQMELSECLSRMNGLRSDFFLTPSEKYYLYQAPGDLLDKLSASIDLSRHTPSPVGERNFWLSSPGNITPIHYDLNDNFLVQLSGVKQVLVWSPQCYEGLRFNPIGDTHDRQSRINPKDEELLNSSGVTTLPVYAHTLTPGQVLHIPFAWPHFVYSETFATSVNYWWDPQFVKDVIIALQLSATPESVEMAIEDLVFKSRPDLRAMITGIQRDGGFTALLHNAFNKMKAV